MSGGVRYLKISLAVTAVLAAAVIYFMVDPAEAGWMPVCPLHRLTGLECPGCGSQRMIHALLHGDLKEAWKHNAFLLCALPAIVWMGWLEIRRMKHPETYRRFHSLPVITAIAVAIVAWGILRNL